MVDEPEVIFRNTLIAMTEALFKRMAFAPYGTGMARSMPADI